MFMINSLMTFFVAILSALSLILGIYSVVINSKARVVRIWFLLSLSIFFWSFYLFCMMHLSVSAPKAIFYSKILHVGASFIPIFFYHFVLYFSLKMGRNEKVLLVCGYLLALIFSFLSLTSLIVAGVSPKFGFDYWVDAGSFYNYMLIYFWIYVFFGFYVLYRNYLIGVGVMKKKSLYLLVASVIAFGGGGMNFLPQTLGIAPYGNFIAWLYPVIVTYGIFIKK